ncbi:MAG TPA: poly-beta-1,6-N-acetyl-D-glucosamine synthase [Spongiibacteraceae bacterium]|jgi:biofilm PGA synthesis N-glycosyltransferase PgaC|nr:poly-beta-1,6-N-acetyl-D-glucosamine synthase [Spongiibacteraceae bacterium]HUH36844.1 poly-beta-1,6-N-acetyl-D-glucosamine synthase [Spongiibacteraceae bacterium]
MQLHTFAEYLLAFAYYYPLFMSYLWMSGGLYYRYHWERKAGRWDQPPALEQPPKVSLIIPCFNEQAQIEETIAYADRLDYPDYEIIAVNDGSSDDTPHLLDALAARFPRLRVIHLEQNAGKANALRMGALFANSEYLVCIDSDAVLDPHAMTWLVRHLLDSPRVAAVTGNPRIRNRSSLLGKVQVGEFSSIIGLIKRAQRIYGRIFTVSGVVTAFRRSALHQVDYWSTDTVTDDIDISWRLQLAHWDIRYEPNALCWILMPETYLGLWRQRLRWALGGVETAFRYFPALLSWRKRRMWPVFIEYLLSLVWSYVLGVVLVLWALGKFVALPDALAVPSLIPGWHGVVLASTCLLQFFVSLLIDSRYERGLLKNYFWMIWYPLAFWLINVLTNLVALPLGLIKRAGRRGRWLSPDRGLREGEQRS